jgi:inner membrane protein
MQSRVFLKLLILGGLSILMLIALASISGITRERKGRLLEVQNDIAASYAGTQRVAGPFVQVDYEETWVEREYNKENDLWYDKERTAQRIALFYPEALYYTGALTVQERYRGIFKANVFQSEGRFSGSVRFPGRDALRREEGSQIELKSAQVCLLVQDPRGIAAVSGIQWGSEALQAEPGGVFKKARGLHAVIADVHSLWEQTIDFELELNLNGTGRIDMVPLGSVNRIQLSSPWPHPSFAGDFLATDRTVSADGFTAEWNVNELACSAQQEMDAGQIENLQTLGVKLIDPVNPYPMTDRALKYGFLFIFITFAAFFLFELIRRLQIHPVQYGFVGLAQALFFLLLLSLSEHTGFGAAYWIGTAATVGVISVYLCSVLKGVQRGALFGTVLLLLYGVLFGLLQSEDHALVAGSVLLFGLLALVMLLTRKVDWYHLGKPEAQNPKDPGTKQTPKV